MILRRGGTHKDKKMAFLIGSHLMGFAIQTGIVLGLGTFLFAHNTTGLFVVSLVANIALTLLAILGIYTAFYIFFPRSSLWPAVVITLLLGVVSLILLLTTHQGPILTVENSIDWNMNFPLSLITFYLLFIGIGSQFYVFTKLFLLASIKEVATLALSLALLSAGGIISSFINFIVFHNIETDIRTRTYDVMQGLLGIAFIFAVFAFSTFKTRTPIIK